VRAAAASRACGPKASRGALSRRPPDRQADRVALLVPGYVGEDLAQDREPSAFALARRAPPLVRPLSFAPPPRDNDAADAGANAGADGDSGATALLVAASAPSSSPSSSAVLVRDGDARPVVPRHLLRASFSPIVKEGLDASAALFTADGETLAQACAIPIHLATLVPVLQAMKRYFPPDKMRDGDADM
jgi:hypothetical protein